MPSPTARLSLSRMVALTQSKWLHEAKDRSKMRRLFVCASGYEARNRRWAETVLSSFRQSETCRYLVIGFTDFAHELSREENDSFYSENGLNMILLGSHDGRGFVDALRTSVESLIGGAGDASVEVHVDYSCMPRLWYCNLPLLVAPLLRNKDRLLMWYTPGEYPTAESFPTAGVEDFAVFAGQPSLNPGTRTHIFGLGFDRIRSQAIWSVLDPQRLVCFYADPGVNEGYVDRVKNDNLDVLAASNHTFSVPLNDVPLAYGLIASVVSDFRAFGDIVLVPDGPKPLILAASLVPSQLVAPGVTCFHVRRRKTSDFKPVDVRAAGEPFGFSLPGTRQCAGT